MRCKPWLLPLFALLSPGAFAAATQEFTLDNGLKVVVREDHRAPVAVTQVWYRVGSSHEPAGKTGLSHALEHMMFKGTEKVPAGEFSRLVAWFGGNDNAFTTDDYTAYYQVYNSNRVPLALELEADRMGVDFMQRAGYRPREAVKLWRNMQAMDEAQGAKGAGGDLGSTHPSDAVRIQALERYLASKGW